MPVITRRKFVRASLAGLGGVYVTTVLPGCGGSDDNSLDAGSFDYGVASGDPLTHSVILWTRLTPADSSKAEASLAWDIARDAGFQELVASGSGTASMASDFTVKVDVQALDADTQYYYRFKSDSENSVVGKTRTLPESSSNSLKLAVLSCSNYPAGYFHVYREVANTAGLDLVLHLGDYIYEYGAGKYASENAEMLGRVPQPAGDLLTLDDYRTRYAQYRSDPDLQAAHAAAPFILVWDDHEVANDAWENGAENHSESQGSYSDRKLAAIRAYFEWLPIRPVTAGVDSDLASPSSIYRQFEWGDLVNLLMLDTRHESRDAPLAITDFFDASTGSFDFVGLSTAVNNPQRKMLGSIQREWLSDAMLTSTATWQLLGQQVLMGSMLLPFAIATQQLSVTEYAELGQLAILAQRAQARDSGLNAEQFSYLEANQQRLTPTVVALLQAPAIPYNLDAWDGYGAERELVYAAAKAANANLVVVAGDTHNAWANRLRDSSDNVVGVEFATTSISSPGLEQYLAIEPAAYAAVEQGIVSLVEDLHYVNVGDRGLLILEFTHEQATAHWRFVSSILERNYGLQSARGYSMRVPVNSDYQLEEL
ncbi:alkaline phosphatase D family protein [Teredinibacter haidensis]|uniref:alkaline phosphatase D family protein n=1 Tax=Teredinibacter haidensis TaxID=2731755 RepID=UPI000948A684|nr:alkaline phosphatase D family protein [Teredinibacter haidensis]